MLELYNLQACIDLYEYDYEREALILPGDNAVRLKALYDMAGEADPEGRRLRDYAFAAELLDRLSHGVGAEWFSDNARARTLYRKALDAVGPHSPKYYYWVKFSRHYDFLSESGNAQWFLDIAIQCVRDMPEAERKKPLPREIDHAAIHFGYGMYLRNQFLSRAKRHRLMFDAGADNVVDRMAGILSPEHNFMDDISESLKKEAEGILELHASTIRRIREMEPAMPLLLTLPEDYEAWTAWKNEPLPERFSTHPALDDMIDADGSPRRCPGLVAALRLSHSDRLRIARIQASLHERLGDALAKPLPMEAVLFPVHALSKPGDEGTVDEQSLADVLEFIEKEEERLHEDTFSKKKEKFESKRCCPIRFTADRIVNWKGQYLALLFRPDGFMDYNLLRLPYFSLDAIQPMPRDETIPRIPLAYFRPGEVDGARLQEAIRAVEAEGLMPGGLTVSRGSLSVQSFTDLYHYSDRFPSICCCDDDGSRSIMAAALLNHRARERGIPLRAFARRTQVMPGQADAAPEDVLQVLKDHGVDIPEALCSAPDILRDEETTDFTEYAMMTLGSLCHAGEMAIPPDRLDHASRILYGAGEARDNDSLEAVFDDISGRVERLLDDFEGAGI